MTPDNAINHTSGNRFEKPTFTKDQNHRYHFDNHANLLNVDPYISEEYTERTRKFSNDVDYMEEEGEEEESSLGSSNLNIKNAKRRSSIDNLDGWFSEKFNFSEGKMSSFTSSEFISPSDGDNRVLLTDADNKPADYGNDFDFNNCTDMLNRELEIISSSNLSIMDVKKQSGLQNGWFSENEVKISTFINSKFISPTYTCNRYLLTLNFKKCYNYEHADEDFDLNKVFELTSPEIESSKLEKYWAFCYGSTVEQWKSDLPNVDSYCIFTGVTCICKAVVCICGKIRNCFGRLRSKVLPRNQVSNYNHHNSKQESQKKDTRNNDKLQVSTDQRKRKPRTKKRKRSFPKDDKYSNQVIQNNYKYCNCRKACEHKLPSRNVSSTLHSREVLPELNNSVNKGNKDFDNLAFVQSTSETNYYYSTRTEQHTNKVEKESLPKVNSSDQKKVRNVDQENDEKSQRLADLLRAYNDLIFNTNGIIPTILQNLPTSFESAKKEFANDILLAITSNITRPCTKLYIYNQDVLQPRNLEQHYFSKHQYKLLTALILMAISIQTNELRKRYLIMSPNELDDRRLIYNEHQNRPRPLLQEVSNSIENEECGLLCNNEKDATVPSIQEKVSLKTFTILNAWLQIYATVQHIFTSSQAPYSRNNHNQACTYSTSRNGNRSEGTRSIVESPSILPNNFYRQDSRDNFSYSSTRRRN